ncbi:(2Fe-2S)-binding protein [Mesorhizobium sp. L-8-10]|uniref:(2Fe-2S)-binding protein n=1 Tax=unclassified Mesorhizobium TaxID=325217 RepID=UPI001926F295|nr:MULTISPECIES: (2Fe-2S)-binding protein [unclassified Mesorhizobium]BCH20552.1 (2Fe-2S)-binding protein [Mesorhizobium sp. L-8-3]BCH28401.1 (2Fe-2S)-binding protein [Mesorhizobium sp. L-8-10]
MSIRLTINGQPFDFAGEPEKPLLWVLREDVGLSGTKYGCGVAACGACTVHVDGVATRSCSLPVGAAAGAEIITIEGLAASNDAGRHPVQQAWERLQVPQCGYCQSGMIMAAAALLVKNPRPEDDEINAAITNLCRCGTYPRIRAAIRSLASEA